MIIAIIVCVTVIFCVIWITLWARHMVVSNLPMFTYGECVWKEEEQDEPNSQPIGFKPEEEQSKDKTAKEAKEAVFKDPVTMTAALLRGEVDIDDITT